MKNETTLKPKSELRALHVFHASQKTAKRFVREYNGFGWTWLVRWIGKMQYTHEEALNLLSDAVEDALIHAFLQIKKPKGFPVARITDEAMLLCAIAMRIPVVKQSVKNEIAEKLLEELKTALRSVDLLLIDGGGVSCEKNGTLFVSRFE